MKRIDPDRKERLRRIAARRERRRQERVAALRALRSSRRRRSASLYPDLVAFYVSHGEVQQAKRRRTSGSLAAPKVFSFIDEPEQAIDLFNKLVGLIQTRPGRLTLGQQKCEQIDLCAASVLNALALAGKDYGVSYSGFTPENLDAREIVIATGLPQALGVERPTLPNFELFPLRRGSFTGGKAKKSSDCDIVTTELIEYLGRCLGRYRKALTDDWTGRLAELIAEVINNCEDHSGRSEWFVAAYLRQPDAREYGDCHITIFNFGQTIAETMKRLPLDAVLRADVEKLIREHTGHRSHRSGAYSTEAIWTVCALQSGVSRYNDASDRVGPRNGDSVPRGNGTVRMMEAFHELGGVHRGDERPIMALVSGRTHIRFDNTYHLKTLQVTREETRQVIAFNPANDLRQPPDPSYVRTLGRYFPGTLLSLRFFLDPAFLDTVPAIASSHRAS